MREMILTNPPFGSKVTNERVLKDFASRDGVTRRNGKVADSIAQEVAFINRCLEFLAPRRQAWYCAWLEIVMTQATAKRFVLKRSELSTLKLFVEFYLPEYQQLIDQLKQGPYDVLSLANLSLILTTAIEPARFVGYCATAVML
jgi:hypothetical protein